MSAVPGLSKGFTALNAMTTFNNGVGITRFATKWLSVASIVSTIALKIYTTKANLERSSQLKAYPSDPTWDQIAYMISIKVLLVSSAVYLLTVPTQWINHRIITHLEG